MRVIEIHEQYWYDNHRRARHSYDLIKLVKEDEGYLGHLPYIHIWDWSVKISTVTSRTGNYLS
jgi:hypothetical protein